MHPQGQVLSLDVTRGDIPGLRVPVDDRLRDLHDIWRAIPATAWHSEVKLISGRTYYWKVKAVGANSHSSWSPIGGFTISEEAPAQATVSTTLAPVTTVIVSEKDVIVSSAGLPAWTLWVVGVVGLVLIGLLIAILFVLVKKRDSRFRL